MYVRISTLADIVGEVLHFPTREILCNRLGVAVPTLNAYRAGTRYPQLGLSSFADNLSSILRDAIVIAGVLEDETSVTWIPAYVVRIMHIEDKLRKIIKVYDDTMRTWPVETDEIVTHLFQTVFGTIIYNKTYTPKKYKKLPTPTPAEALKLLFASKTTYLDSVSLLKWYLSFYHPMLFDNSSRNERYIYELDELTEMLSQFKRPVFSLPVLYDMLLICCKEVSLTADFQNDGFSLAARSVTDKIAISSDEIVHKHTH